MVSTPSHDAQVDDRARLEQSLRRILLETQSLGVETEQLREREKQFADAAAQLRTELGSLEAPNTIGTVARRNALDAVEGKREQLLARLRRREQLREREHSQARLLEGELPESTWKGLREELGRREVAQASGSGGVAAPDVLWAWSPDSQRVADRVAQFRMEEHQLEAGEARLIEMAGGLVKVAASGKQIEVLRNKVEERQRLALQIHTEELSLSRRLGEPLAAIAAAKDAAARAASCAVGVGSRVEALRLRSSQLAEERERFLLHLTASQRKAYALAEAEAIQHTEVMRSAHRDKELRLVTWAALQEEQMLQAQRWQQREIWNAMLRNQQQLQDYAGKQQLERVKSALSRASGLDFTSVLVRYVRAMEVAVAACFAHQGHYLKSLGTDIGAEDFTQSKEALARSLKREHDMGLRLVASARTEVDAALRRVLDTDEEAVDVGEPAAAQQAPPRERWRTLSLAAAYLRHLEDEEKLYTTATVYTDAGVSLARWRNSELKGDFLPAGDMRRISLEEDKFWNDVARLDAMNPPGVSSGPRLARAGAASDRVAAQVLSTLH